MRTYSRSTAKRVFDVIFAGLGLILLSPVFILVAFAILISDGRPVLFIQKRVGLDGLMFRMYKFRTMVKNAEFIGRQVTVGGDDRITPIGRFLRNAKIDELPQLLNVLIGNMSFVGPRPEVEKYVSIYTSEQREVLRFTPGITDPASIKYRDESSLLAESSDPERTYIEEIMPDKIRLNLEYAEKASLFTDLCLIMRTLNRLCASKGEQ